MRDQLNEQFANEMTIGPKNFGFKAFIWMIEMNRLWHAKRWSIYDEESYKFDIPGLVTNLILSRTFSILLYKEIAFQYGAILTKGGCSMPDLSSLFLVGVAVFILFLNTLRFILSNQKYIYLLKWSWVILDKFSL